MVGEGTNPDKLSDSYVFRSSNHGKQLRRLAASDTVTKVWSECVSWKKMAPYHHKHTFQANSISKNFE